MTPFALACLVMAPFGLMLCTTLVSYGFFCYDMMRSPYRDELKQLSGGKVKQWVFRGIFSSYLSVLFSACIFPLGLLNQFRQSKTDPACPFPSVVLVHGLFHNSSGWLLYRRWLKRAGFVNIYTLDYPSWKHSFEDALERLSVLIEERVRPSEQKPVILIGHSLGGLLARAYADEAANASKVALVVTLGTPHQGSKLAAWGIGELARSLAYQGTLIRRMEQGTPSSHIPRVSFYSPVDNMVIPHQALKTAHSCWTYQQTPPIGHVAMLYHRRTVERVIEYLKEVCGSTRNMPLQL